jgi:hypothetical protein
VKNINVVGDEMTKNGHKMTKPTQKVVSLITNQSLLPKIKARIRLVTSVC